MTSIRTLLAAVAALVLAVGCGSSHSSSDSNVYIDGFDPGPVPDGYTRYVTPPIRGIQPGEDNQWCQYISQAPTDRDLDVVDVIGQQSKGGHHAVLYATKTPGAYGSTHDCGATDMGELVFLGGAGGEGTSSAGKALPDGVVFRVPAGYYLMANVHFINATDKVVDGQAVLDMKTAVPDGTRTMVTLFTNVGIQSLAIPAMSPGKLDTQCTFKKDLDFYLFANHMHEHGTSIFSEILRTDGTHDMLRQDPTWSSHNMFSPTFVTWDKTAPMKIHAGDVLHTHCEWFNNTGDEIQFPAEMCVGFGFFAGQDEIDCVDGNWGG